MLSVIGHRELIPMHEQNESNSLLKKIHKNIYHLTWPKNLQEGWKAYKKSDTYTGWPVVDKVCLISAGVVIVIFSGTSMIFATLALKQAVEDIGNDGKAPIIGHFSEWTIQAMFCLSLYGRILHDIALSGEQKRAHKIFMKAINQEDLTDNQRSIIYEDYVKFIENRPSTTWISPSNLPQPPDTPTSLDDLLRLDQSLREIYDDLENQFSHFTYFQQLRKGLMLIASHTSICSLTLIKTALVIGGTFITIHLANYVLGISWSAQQSYEDFYDNPSIGGHSLEWGVESLVLLNIVLYYFREIANVGKAKMLTDLFYEKIDALREESSLLSIKMAERLFGNMKGMVENLPRGFFFKIPTWLIFRDIKEEDV